MPEHIAVMADDNFCNHYIELAPVKADWGLSSPDQRDVGAKVAAMSIDLCFCLDLGARIHGS